MKHQDYMNKVYEYWQKNNEITRHQACNHFGPIYKAAVQMGNFNYQVNNGGISQWAFNGYMVEDIKDLINLFAKAVTLDIGRSKDIYSILKRILEETDDNPDIVNAPTETDYSICTECGGSGEFAKTCWECDGNGEIEEETCHNCNGEGEITDTCGECGGSGELEEEISPGNEFYSAVGDLDHCYYDIEGRLTTMHAILDRFEEVQKTEPAEDPTNKKPECKLIGQDGNIFNLIGIARKALKKNKQYKKAFEMTERITKTAKSYDQALSIIMEYVEVS